MAFKIKGIVSTTKVDLQNEKIAVSALEGMAAAASVNYIPLLSNHDPRLPPIGRTLTAQVVPLGDGEFALEAESEIFEPGDKVQGDGREMVLKASPPGTLTVSADYTYRSSPERLKEAQVLAEMAGAGELGYEVKKAADPLSILTIAAGFVVGGIAAGFFGKIGSDAFDKVAGQLKKIFAGKAPEKERLLRFLLTVHKDGVRVNVDVILTNPTPEEIDDFLKRGLKRLDKLVEKVFDQAAAEDVRSVTIEIRDGEPEIRFGVRKDCFPVYPTKWVKGLS